MDDRSNDTGVAISDASYAGLSRSSPARTARMASALLDDEAARGDDDPPAVLFADRLHPAEPRQHVAGLHLDEAVAPLDQRRSVAHLIERPAVDDRRLLEIG